jgi:hypothetical protein
MKSRHNRLGLVTAAVVVVVASVLSPTWAWASHYYSSKGAETNTFTTHIMQTPAKPTCPGLAVLSVTLSWTVTDAGEVTSYWLGESGSSGGTYTYTDEHASTSATVGISLGLQYFEVYTMHDLWSGSPSAPVAVDGLLVAATCS